MRSTPLLAIAALAAPLVQAASLGHPAASVIARRGHNQKNTCLRDDTMNTGSTNTGLEPELKPEDGQYPSTTDDANFINFCSGKTITNGQMINDSTCNPIVMGDLPSASNMVSVVITSPQHGDVLGAEEDFTIKVATKNLHTGAFTNPFGTYYAAPQQLDDDGLIIGHTHLTVQSIGDFKSTTPPNPEEFAWFAGVKEKAVDGVLSAKVAGGLPAGVYRLCTLVAAANHQPVMMPTAQRGAQDDCVRFEVKDGGDQGSEHGGLYVEVGI